MNLQYTTKVWKDGCIEGRRRSLSPMNEFFLTLCRIKAGLFEQDLANQFQISQSTVSLIITSWINFIYAKFKEVPTWPSRQVIDCFMPYQFENLYPSTRCIIDATEIYIQMPSNPSAQQLTFSSYKNYNTVKSLIAITPSGSISFVSDLYGGNISDKKLNEKHRDGLASTLTTHCSKCNEEFTVHMVKGLTGKPYWEANVAATWDQMSTGGGHSRLEESMVVLRVPVMTKKAFMAAEQRIGEWWQTLLQESTKAAGEEEKAISLTKNRTYDGIPAIMVIVDDGWSKRAHKHSYNAKSGVGIIIGKETGKILFMGVRNKYCAVCSKATDGTHHLNMTVTSTGVHHLLQWKHI